MVRVALLLVTATATVISTAIIAQMIPYHMYYFILWGNIPALPFFVLGFAFEKKRQSFTELFHLGDFGRGALVLGLLYLITNLANFGTYNTPPTVQSALSQVLVICVFIFSRVLLKKRMGRHRVAGVCIIVIGFWVAWVPTFTSFPKGGLITIVWSIIFSIGNLALSPIAVCLEYYLKVKRQLDEEVSISKVCFWIMFLATVGLAVCFWVNILPGIEIGSLDELGRNLKKAFECTFIWETPTYPHNATAVPMGIIDKYRDHCTPSLLVWLIIGCIAGNVYFYVGTWVNQCDDANWNIVIAASLGPTCAQLLMSWELLMGPFVAPGVSIYNIISVLTIVLGIILYKWEAFHEGVDIPEKDISIKNPIMRFLFPVKRLKELTHPSLTMQSSTAVTIQ